MSTTATLDPPRSVLEAGREGTATLTLRNDSDIVEEYSFQVVGDPAEWTRVDPPEVTVYPGQSATAVVTFKPPRSTAVPAGENPYGIHVQPAKRAENATVPEGVLEVLPFYETVAELSPQTAKGKGAEQYRISVANRGNAPVAVALAGKSASDELELTLGESKRTVEPGTTWTSELRGEPTERLWRGTPTAYPFTVTVMPVEGPQIALAGTQYQEPVLPAWLPKALLLLPILAVLGFLLFQWLQPRPTVPPLAGKEVSVAEAELRDEQLKSQRVDRSDDETPRDRVVSTDPTVGTELKKDDTVTLYVSTGPGTVPVPSVAGQEVSAAEKALEDVGLVPRRVDVSDENVPSNQVVSTDPMAGTKLKGGESVALKVSKGPSSDGATASEGTATPEGTTGPEDVVVPNGLVGQPEEAVRQAVESAGLVVGSTRSEDHPTVAEGHVIDVVPPQGTTLKSGAEVELVVSTGQVKVPQLEGLSLEEAIAALGAEEVQLPYAIERTARAGVEPEQVVGQSIAADQSVAQGTPITLTVTEASIPTLPDNDIPLSAPPDGVPVSTYWPEGQATHPFTVTRMDISIARGDDGTLMVERVDPTGTAIEVPISATPLADLDRGTNLIADEDSSAPAEDAAEGGGFVPIEPIRVAAGERLKFTLTCNYGGGGAECVESFSVDGEFD